MDPLDEDRLFGRLLVDLKLVAPAAVEAALAEQQRRAAAGERRRLGQVLVEQAGLSPEHVTQVLELQGKVLMVCGGCGGGDRS